MHKSLGNKIWLKGDLSPHRRLNDVNYFITQMGAKTTDVEWVTFITGVIE